MAAADEGTETHRAIGTREDMGKWPGHRRQGVKEVASHVGILIGVDDLALPIHDAVDGDPRDDIGMYEFQLVYELR